MGEQLTYLACRSSLFRFSLNPFFAKNSNCVTKYFHPVLERSEFSMDKNRKLQKQRKRRRNHVRNKLRGTADHPRLCVHRSLKHFSCQVIDDLAGKTLASASTREKAMQGSVANGGNCDAAAQIGKLIAEKATAAGIKSVKLDRGHNKYHGRVKAFADAARESGLQL